jgi:D-alanyl-D-alanine carboxypeptidase/D-alanyl-D-alanine-endopeptidase (penicillin-binding protein 4)
MSKRSFLSHILILLLVIIGGTFQTAEAQQVSPSEKAKIEQAYSKFKSLPQMENGLASFTVYNAKTGEVVFSDQGALGLAPASTLKNITAATALSVLGSDYRFRTTLLTNGFVDQNGTLQGDLIIKGSGDPTLGSARYEETKEQVILEKWAQALKNKGIKAIQGRIIGDDMLYAGYVAPDGWPWADMGNYYGAGVSALNWRENSFGVNFKPGNKEGDATTISSTTADVSYLNIINEVTTGKRGSGDQVYAYAAPYSSKIFFRGTHGLDLNKTISMSIPDPAYDLAFQLREFLNKAGIQTESPISSAYELHLNNKDYYSNISELTEIDVHLSPTLDKIVYWFNRVSINLYGEALLKALAQKEGISLNTANAAKWMSDYWATKLGIPTGQLKIADGSGLSPNNRITTDAMVKILLYNQDQPWFSAYLDSFPVINEMKMKSGTINGVLGYAGYHESANGNQFVFSILVSNYHGGAQAMRNQLFNVLNILK